MRGKVQKWWLILAMAAAWVLAQAATVLADGATWPVG